MEKTKMKIAFLSFYSGLVNRGVETYVDELATKLVSIYKHDCMVIQAGVPKQPKSYQTIVIKNKADFTKGDTATKLAHLFFLDYWSRKVLGFTLRAIPYIWKEKPKVVITGNGGWEPILIRLTTWLYGGKLVISGQAGIGWDEILNLWIFPDAFIPISSFAVQWAKKTNPFIKLRYIPNGVDLEKFQKGKKRLKVNLKKPIVLFVGALVHSKRPLRVIEAVSETQFSLLMVGDGYMKEQVKKLGKKLLKNRFYLTRFPHDKMPEVYKSADVFTIPSQPYHSFEIVLVEAMASGLPVVANNDLIRKEIIGNAGILVDPDNINEYSQVLEKALNTKWGNKPRLQAEKFSWNKVAEEYDKLFRFVINGVEP